MSETLDNSQASVEETQTQDGQSVNTEGNEPTTVEADLDQSERPVDKADNSSQELIAGKFKSVDDLVKSYKELEREHTKAKQNKDLSRTAYDVSEIESAKDNLGKLGDEIVKSYVQQKEESIFNKSVELGHEYLKERKDVLMRLAQTPEFQTSSYPEIYEAVYGKPELRADVSERKQQASATVSGSSTPSGGEEWTQERIDSLSNEEFQKNKQAIAAYFVKKREGK